MANQQARFQGDQAAGEEQGRAKGAPGEEQGRAKGSSGDAMSAEINWQLLPPNLIYWAVSQGGEIRFNDNTQLYIPSSWVPWFLIEAARQTDDKPAN